MKKSKLGYKRYSPDVKKPYNVIPSGRITMQDVDFPVFGIDDMGNEQMMYPGGEYQFPGSQVFEVPVYQQGGTRKPIYTSNPNDPRLKAYRDSLSLYNKTEDIENPKYYENGKPSWWTFKGTIDESGRFAKKNNIDVDYQYYATGRFPGKIQPESTGDWGEGMSYPKYKKPVQPVEYKKLEKVEIAPKERSIPMSSIKINRSVNFPKTITGVKYDTQKGDVIVGINGEDITMPRKEFDIWVNTPENRELYNEYRASQRSKYEYGGNIPMAQYGNQVQPSRALMEYLQRPENIQDAKETEYARFMARTAPASGRIEPSYVDFNIMTGVGAGLSKANAMKKAIWLPKRSKPSQTETFLKGFGMGMLSPFQYGGQGKAPVFPQPVLNPALAKYLQSPESIEEAKERIISDAKGVTLESKVNRALGNPKRRAAGLSEAVADLSEGPIDNIRHTAAGMYTSNAIAEYLNPDDNVLLTVPAKAAGFIGSNLGGIGHEIKAFVPSLDGDYRNVLPAARMTLEDTFNNFVGSALSVNPFMTEKEKEDFIINLSNSNLLPDGYEQMSPSQEKDMYVKEFGGDLEEFGSGGLKQWFAEKWVDIKTGEECGRSGKDKNGRPYPACRPSRRVNSTTPKTTSEMSSSEKAKFKSVKNSGKRISYNHTRKQDGGQMPTMDNVEGMFDYWMNNYNTSGLLKDKSREEALDEFKKIYLKAATRN